MQLFADTNTDAVAERFTKSDTNCDSNSYCDSDSYCHSNRNTNRNSNTVPNSAKFCRSGHNHGDSWPHWSDRLLDRLAGV
jgi:hypothetical protein